MPVDYTKAMRPNLYELMQGGGGEQYILPPATDTTLGGVIAGANLTVDSNGRLSATVPDISNLATKQELQSDVDAIIDTFGYWLIEDTVNKSYAFKLYSDMTIEGFYTVQHTFAFQDEFIANIYQDAGIEIALPSALTDVAELEYGYSCDISVLDVTGGNYAVIAQPTALNPDVIIFDAYSIGNNGSVNTMIMLQISGYYSMIS